MKKPEEMTDAEFAGMFDLATGISNLARVACDDDHEKTMLVLVMAALRIELNSDERRPGFVALLATNMGPMLARHRDAMTARRESDVTS